MGLGDRRSAPESIGMTYSGCQRGDMARRRTWYPDERNVAFCERSSNIGDKCEHRRQVACGGGAEAAKHKPRIRIGRMLRGGLDITQRSVI